MLDASLAHASDKRRPTLPDPDRSSAPERVPGSHEPASGSDPKASAAPPDAAFTELVRTHTPRLLRVARRYLDDDEARDAVQDAFVKAHARIDRFENRAAPGTWLHRIVVNGCIDRLRRAAARRETPLDEVTDEALERCLAAGVRATSPDRTLEAADLERACRACILRLPPAFRTVLLLRDVEGYDVGEAARTLGISASLVKVRLHRARRALRDALAPVL